MFISEDIKTWQGIGLWIHQIVAQITLKFTVYNMKVFWKCTLANLKKHKLIIQNSTQVIIIKSNLEKDPEHLKTLSLHTIEKERVKWNDLSYLSL